jgi:curved DNA-binding protein CbpA
VAKRDPHVVLGLERGATQTQIKAAWRRLARVNHPDLTGDDPAASRAATRRMAEINNAYAALSREAARDARSTRASVPDDAAPRRGGPPPPRPTRPVTARVDTTASFRPRNQTTSGARAAFAGAGSGPRVRAGTRLPPAPEGERLRRDPPRASTPTGPLERDRIRNFRRPKPPRLDAARAVMLEFGKFHDHTLGEIAAFEPSYIDWLASTVTRDPDLVAAARVVQADLDGRGVVRRARPPAVRPGRTA